MTRLRFASGVGRTRDARLVRGLLPEHDLGSNAWWQAVAVAGTPLRVPAAAGDGHEVLVFVHRDERVAGAYLDLVGLTDRDDLAAGTMERVVGTDVWWAAFGVDPGFVGSYGLIPLDGPLVSPAARDTDEARRWWIAVLARSGSDPLNPGPVYRAMRDEPRSVTTAAGAGRLDARAAAGAATGEPAAPGELIETVWARADGVREHPVWIHVPPGPHREPLPVVVLLDGQLWATNLPVAPVLDALRADGRTPPLVAVLVGSGDSSARGTDLTCDDAFVDAVVDDLLTGLVGDLLASRGLTATRDPARTAVVGQSYGGLTALYAAARRPDRFGLVLSQSGSFWWPDPAEAGTRRMSGWLRSAPPRQTRTVLQVGEYEGPLTEANREVAELIGARGEWLRLTEVPGGHDWAWWRARLAGGLEALFGR